MIQTTFQRYEKKYLLTPAQYQWIFQQLQSRMQVNEYGIYPICSIYFDTDDYRLIRASLEKPVYKEKLRLRSYGAPSRMEDPVFLELKKKYKGVVYKRRVDMSLGECRDYFDYGLRPESDGQILHEIDWFQQLWKTYFKSTTIKERLNPRKHKQDMPVRYWKYLTEKQK